MTASVSEKGLLNCTMAKHRADEKLGLTKTMINNARQLSRSLVGVCHWRDIKYERFGGRPLLVFYTLDLVVLAKNLKKFSGALFDIFGVKVEKFKNYLNELQKFPTRYYLICDCGPRQTTNHTVDTCPLTKFDAAVNLLHEADDDAVIWLESTATAALTK